MTKRIYTVRGSGQFPSMEVGGWSFLSTEDENIAWGHGNSAERVVQVRVTLGTSAAATDWWSERGWTVLRIEPWPLDLGHATADISAEARGVRSDGDPVSATAARGPMRLSDLPAVTEHRRALRSARELHKIIDGGGYLDASFMSEGRAFVITTALEEPKVRALLSTACLHKISEVTAALAALGVVVDDEEKSDA